MYPFYTLKEAGKLPEYRTAEAALPMNTSHDSLRGHLRKALMAAHGVANTYDNNGPWVGDVFPTHVTYSHNGDTFKRSYTSTAGSAGADPAITLGANKKVHVAYVDSAEASKESMRVLLGVAEGLTEASDWYTGLNVKERTNVIITLEDGSLLVRESVIFSAASATELNVTEAKGGKTTVPVCIIKPGWGSMAHYSQKMIQESGPKAFRKGTQMYINHATEAEESQRPEGDLNALAAVLNKDAYWDAAGPLGAGLYSEALLFSDHSNQILEKGPYTGCSINAAIKASEGSADGRTGMIAESFVRAYSVDFVTKAGAGGAPIVPVMESARGGAPLIEVKESSMATLTDQEITDLRKQLADSQAQIRTMEAQNNRILATATVALVLKEAGVTVRPSLLDRVCAFPTMKEGKVDLDWAKAVAEDLMDGAEAGGRVSGMGEGGSRTREADARRGADEDKAFKESLAELGVPQAGLDYAMKGGR